MVRERANDPSFGSVARVRRAGLDCRNNLKMASYGHIDVFRIETMQALDEAFKILSAQDVRSLFGADSAWDVVEQMMARYFNKEVNPSQHYRMAVAGRHILGWLAQDHVLKTSQTQFETLLQDIANDAEDWYTSAVTLGMLNVGGAKPILLKRPGASRRNGKRPVGQESFL